VLLVGTGSAAHKVTFKAALVSDVGRFNDKGFNQNQLTGLKLAQSKLGVQIRAIESHSAGDYIPNLASLARLHYDAVVAAGFLLANAEATVAKKFPNTQFAITDYPVEIPPFSDSKGKLLVKNITGITFKSEQQSYLVGCLSALMAKRDGGKTISATGGVKIPPVDSFIAGYRAGAGKCVPGTKVLIGYSQDFIAQDKCKAVAENQIAAGSKVVFAVAGPCGFGALAAAKEGGVWGDGVDVDQSYLGPHILTSAVKRVDLGVFRFIQAVQTGTLIPGHDFVFDLKNGGVALGKISSKVPKAYIAKLNALKEQIELGKIKIPTAV
jgi:basic membrane protein A